jgi:hypothetical protein
MELPEDIRLAIAHDANRDTIMGGRDPAAERQGGDHARCARSDRRDPRDHGRVVE